MLSRALAISCLGVMACYSPTPSQGKPCGDGGKCPADLRCAPATNTCEVPDFAPPDSGTDSPAPDAQFCFGTGMVTSCIASAPVEPIDIGTNLTLNLDTSDSASCDLVIGSEPELCILLGSTITVTGVIRAQGTRPLVLVAATTISIDGLVDVASRRGQPVPGAGGNSVDCPIGVAAVTNSGGWGASFGGLGGNGSLGNPAAATAGTAPAVPALPTNLRGGCKAGEGAGVIVSPPGDGGGAVYVIAGTSISIGAAGKVNASGGGGGGCQTNCGGGGGGSGGMIGLDAPQITIADGGEVFANGGGGGEGSQSNPSRAGGESTTATTQGVGGAGGTAGGDGGGGSIGATLDGVTPAAPTATNAGGGAGGGGAGIVKTHGTLANQGTISPAPI